MLIMHGSTEKVPAPEIRTGRFHKGGEIDG